MRPTERFSLLGNMGEGLKPLQPSGVRLWHFGWLLRSIRALYDGFKVSLELLVYGKARRVVE